MDILGGNDLKKKIHRNGNPGDMVKLFFLTRNRLRISLFL